MTKSGLIGKKADDAENSPDFLVRMIFNHEKDQMIEKTGTCCSNLMKNNLY